MRLRVILLGAFACTPHASEVFPPLPAFASLGASDAAARCRAGDGGACNDAGVFAWEQEQRPDFVGRSGPSAGELLQKGCVMGNAIACSNVDLIHALVSYAESEEKGRTAAPLAILEGLCARGSRAGCFALGAIRIGMPLGVRSGDLEIHPRREDRDNEAGAILFEKGCRLGASDACLALGIAIERGWRPVPQGHSSEVEGSDFMLTACRRGTPMACNDWALVESSAEVREYAKAARHWERACAAGLSSACITIATASETSVLYSSSVSKAFWDDLLDGCVYGENEAACDPDVRHKPEAHSPRPSMLARLGARCTATDKSGCPKLRVAEVFAECERTQAAWACAPFARLPGALDRVHPRPESEE